MAADVYTVPLLPRQVVEALEKDREFRRLECIVMWLEVQQRELLEDHQDEITGVRTRTIYIYPFHSSKSRCQTRLQWYRVTCAPTAHHSTCTDTACSTFVQMSMWSGTRGWIKDGDRRWGERDSLDPDAPYRRSLVYEGKVKKLSQVDEADDCKLLERVWRCVRG